MGGFGRLEAAFTPAPSKRGLYQGRSGHAQDLPPQPSSRPPAPEDGVSLLCQWDGASLEADGPLGTKQNKKGKAVTCTSSRNKSSQ